MPGASTDRKIDKLLSLLVKNATVVVPGPKIASEIGGTRSTVWLWIEKLRALGVEIKGHPASGYQLSKLPDILVPGLLRPELGEIEIGRRIVHYFRVTSTNSVALTLAAEGAPHGTVVLAEEQTAGRGRFGRVWYSEKSSGIYASVILRPPLAPAAAPALTLMAGVAAHRALTAATGLPVDIRWPNDLLIGGKKVGGILTEMHAEPSQVRFVIVGIGINVNQEKFPGELSAAATSLRVESGKMQPRAELLVRLLREFENDYNRFVREGAETVTERFSRVSSYAVGKRVSVTTGAESYGGTTAGLSAEGLLRVKRDDGETVTVIAGDVAEAR